MKTKRADFAAASLRGRMIVAGGLGESVTLWPALILRRCCYTKHVWTHWQDLTRLSDSKRSLTATTDESCGVSSSVMWWLSHSCDVVLKFSSISLMCSCVSMLPRPWTYSPGHCGGLPSSEEKVGESVSDGIPTMLHILHRHQRSPPGGGRS